MPSIPRLPALIAVSSALTLVVACAGDDPSGPGGDSGTSEDGGNGGVSRGIEFERATAHELMQLIEAAHDDEASSVEGWSFQVSREARRPDVYEDAALAFFIAKNDNADLAVVFRATGELADQLDWIRDTDGYETLGRWEVHEGIRGIYEGMQPQLQSDLLREMNGLSLDQRQNGRVYVTGHGIGGSLATLAALNLGPAVSSRAYHRDNVALYAFGPTRVITFKSGDTGYESVNGVLPHHFAIARSEDPLPHALHSTWNPDLFRRYIHLPRMIAVSTNQDRDNHLNVPITKGRFEAGPGRHFGNNALRSVANTFPVGSPTVNPAEEFETYAFAHSRAGYQTMMADELELVEAPYADAHVNRAGEMSVEGWHHQVVGIHDMIAMWRDRAEYASDGDHRDRTAISNLPLFDGFLYRQYYAPDTGVAKSTGYVVAYVNIFGVHVSVHDYTPEIPHLAIAAEPSIIPFARDNTRISWGAPDVGKYDYVALYFVNPKNVPSGQNVGARAYVPGTRIDVMGSDGTEVFTTYEAHDGYYAAYVTSEKRFDGYRYVLRVVGPSHE